MFLVAHLFGIACDSPKRNRAFYLTLSCAWLAVSLQAQPPKPECLLEVRVYNADGDPVRSEILGLGSEDPQLNAKASAAVVTKAGIRFPIALTAFGLYQIKIRVHDFMPRDPRGRNKRTLEFRHDVVLFNCEQRTSVEVGHNDTNMDVGGATVFGKITGCLTDASWWVRAMPMFGGQTEYSVYEGFIRNPSGAFRLTAPMRGERHILIIGRGKQPLKSLGVNVTSGGGKTDVGEINLERECQSK